jgi:hypothetical protein
VKRNDERRQDRENVGSSSAAPISPHKRWGHYFFDF